MELNEKLLKFVDGQGVCYGCEGQGDSQFLGRCSICKGTGKLPLAHPMIRPDLVHSLDAQFKWVVPKVRDKVEEIQLVQMMNDWLCDILDGETPAPALARAVEKLIDAEVKE